MSADGLGRPRAGKAPLGLALVAALVLAACRPEAEPMMLGARPVRTVVAERNEAGTPITLTGRIEAEDEVSLTFRISGQILESDLELGDNVQAGSSSPASNRKTSSTPCGTAKAHLAAAQGQLTQARAIHFNARTHCCGRVDNARKPWSSRLSAKRWQYRSCAGGSLQRGRGGCGNGTAFQCRV